MGHTPLHCGLSCCLSIKSVVGTHGDRFYELTMHLPLPHFFSVLPFLNDNTKKKPTETSHKKFPEGKQVHVEMKASKTN